MSGTIMKCPICDGKSQMFMPKRVGDRPDPGLLLMGRDIDGQCVTCDGQGKVIVHPYYSPESDNDKKGE